MQAVTEPVVVQDKEVADALSKSAASAAAFSHGHDLDEWWLNKDIWVAKCKKCLSLALVRENGTIEGTATLYPCDTAMTDKTGTFPRGYDYTPETKALLDGSSKSFSVK